MAAHLGLPVSEMVKKMTYREFEKWMYLFNHKPFGEVAQDGRFFDLIIFAANLFTPKGKRKQPFQYFIKRTVKVLKTISSKNEGWDDEAIEEMAASFRQQAQNWKQVGALDINDGN